MDAQRLFEEHHGALFRYVVRLTGDADLAHDAVQETFTRLLSRPPRDENPRAWLFTVATNIVRAAASRGLRHRALLEQNRGRAPVPEPVMRPDDAIERLDERRRVRAALDALPERERTILLMREEGFSHREIAEAVGTTTGSVGTMIARALDRLAALLPLDAVASGDLA
jgi:RNA polymerase sigma-70 factor (ECF subfamily)